VCLLCSEDSVKTNPSFELFTSVDDWDNYDVVLYTETLTVGVDY
jgi:hypothetical protein